MISFLLTFMLDFTSSCFFFTHAQTVMLSYRTSEHWILWVKKTDVLQFSFTKPYFILGYSMDLQPMKRCYYINSWRGMRKTGKEDTDKAKRSYPEGCNWRSMTNGQHSFRGFRQKGRLPDWERFSTAGASHTPSGIF